VAAHAAAALLLALLAWQADRAAAVESPTFDETSHLVSGFSYWHARDFRLNPESGVFPQLWAALPLWLADAAPPDFSGAAWRAGEDWLLAREFLYGAGNDPEQLLRPARRMIVLLALALGVVVYVWSSRLYGAVGGLLSLTLYALCPNVLAHGHLVTADMAVAFAFLLAAAAASALLARVGAARVLAASLAMGLLLLSKFAALLFAPVLALLWGLRVVSPRAPRLGDVPLEARPARAAVLLGALLWAGVGAALMVWAVYALESAAPGPRPFDWSRIEALGGWRAALVLGARELRLLPETWLYGLGYTLGSTQERVAFAAGRGGMGGWWWYFPLAALVKTPLGTLGLWAVAAAAGLRAWWRGPSWDRALRLAPLWAVVGVYASVSLAAGINIGLRHLLPAYAAGMVLSGAAIGVARSRPGALAVAALLAATVAESLSVSPHYLAFFNRAAGGPAAGHRLLIDSNLDWGQDLPGLARWLEERRAGGGAAPCYLSYFGTAEPRAHGVDCARLPGFPDLWRPRRVMRLEPGLYAVSATMLQALHVPLDVRGAWSPERESRWREVQRLVAGQEQAAWSPLRERYDWLRFARLMAWLRTREPDDDVGGSILLYRLDAGALRAALHEPLPGGQSGDSS
jgi:hypothetical protein